MMDAARRLARPHARASSLRTPPRLSPRGAPPLDGEYPPQRGWMVGVCSESRDCIGKQWLVAPRAIRLNQYGILGAVCEPEEPSWQAANQTNACGKAAPRGNRSRHSPRKVRNANRGKTVPCLQRRLVEPLVGGSEAKIRIRSNAHADQSSPHCQNIERCAAQLKDSSG